MMEVGDLVMFRNCELQGTVGIISEVSNPSALGKANPLLRLYWVVFEDGEQCFTGTQLELVV
tara:strand:- start:977 stop:1162 length:186 start_codon:yes stop_codon:yes gene_type:complete